VQVGTKFGEGTFGKLLSDGQVGRFRDESGVAISMFGHMLPPQGAGLFSSRGSALEQDARTTMDY